MVQSHRSLTKKVQSQGAIRPVLCVERSISLAVSPDLRPKSRCPTRPNHAYDSPTKLIRLIAVYVNKSIIRLIAVYVYIRFITVYVYTSINRLIAIYDYTG